MNITSNLNESTVEEAALSWFDELGYAALHGPANAPGEPGAERDGFEQVILADRLRNAIDTLNPNIPREAREEAFRMVVCMSRRICVDLYNEIINLRPDWHDDDDEKGVCKIVMTGSASDPIEWQPHVRNKRKRKELAKRFKKTNDSFRLVIVRDMWLTGFDVPCLHTMYVDKPMRGHGLMQASTQLRPSMR
jgi:type I site-specific restriction-modification system R (restriction) subunit